MRARRIDHIGIAVNDLDEAIPFYRDVLGLELAGIEEVESQKVRVAMFVIGESHIELLEPTSPESPIAKALDKRGPGIHHIAYAVDDAEKAVGSMLSSGVRMIDETPRDGAGGSRIAFVHPSSSGKVLTELCEHSSQDRERD